jgi:protein-S-isoprenylcysteine O-methyltransferase Ste14
MILAVVLFLFFDRKSRSEEAWLLETYPSYAEYRGRVKKLIPGIY